MSPFLGSCFGAHGLHHWCGPIHAWRLTIVVAVEDVYGSCDLVQFDVKHENVSRLLVAWVRNGKVVRPDWIGVVVRNLN